MPDENLQNDQPPPQPEPQRNDGAERDMPQPRPIERVNGDASRPPQTQPAPEERSPEPPRGDDRRPEPQEEQRPEQRQAEQRQEDRQEQRPDNRGEQRGERRPDQRQRRDQGRQRQPRDTRFERQPREARDQREPREGREQAQVRDGREQRENREPREGRDQRGGQTPAASGGLDLSVVIPLLNEEDSLKELHQQLRSALSRMNLRYELIFVDDGSTDRSFQVLRDLRRNDHRLRVIRFRRNYGKSAALSAGFEKAQGQHVVTLDADLQDDPSEIPSMIKRLGDGYDLISGWKKVRRDPLSKTIPSRFFNFVTSLLTGIRIHDFNCGLKAYRRDVIKTVKVYGELHRYIPVLAHWEGFRIGEMVVKHRPRKYGKTKFGLGRFWKGFLDLLTALFTTRYIRRPLHLFGFWGLCFFLAGLVIAGWLAAEWFLGQTALSNRPLFLGGIFLMLMGVQLISIGLLGEMISKHQAGDEYQVREFIR